MKENMHTWRFLASEEYIENAEYFPEYGDTHCPVETEAHNVVERALQSYQSFPNSLEWIREKLQQEQEESSVVTERYRQ